MPYHTALTPNSSEQQSGKLENLKQGISSQAKCLPKIKNENEATTRVRF